MKKKIYHIHSDFKFLYDSERFDNERFENQLIILDEKSGRNQLYHNQAIFFPNEDESISKIVHLVSDGDLVVIYELCEIKKKIVKNLPKETKIGWRFFGHELYGFRRDLMLSKKTIEIVENKGKYRHDFIFRIILSMKYWNRKNIYKKQQKIINHIDFILLFFDEEYNFLKKHWKIPAYQKLNINNKIPIIEYQPEKILQVIVGNSRNIYNNHIDILDIIKKNADTTTSISLFFNYGATGPYSQEVERQASRIKNVHLVKDFLSKEDFENIYKNSAALVINSYRQMALGNIVTAIKYGLKIYLNDKNPTKNWLSRKGIEVFSISQLGEDLKSHNLILTKEMMDLNIMNFNKIAEEFTKEEFNDDIYKILTK